MLSPYRSSLPSFRSLVRSASSQQAQVQQARPVSRHQSSGPSSPSSSLASTSRQSLSSSQRNAHSSAVQSMEKRAEASSEQKSSGPAFNMRLTPKAAQDIEHIQAWLGDAFPNLAFPDDVALQMITHESWDHGVSAGHNRRLGFLGRRAMKFYLSLFMSRHSTSSGMIDSGKINDLLHTSKLGESVGKSLKLNEVMRWTPAVSDGQQGPKEMGLYKIRGVTVEALLGAIYHQHGAQVARGFFSARILPFLDTLAEAEAETLKNAIASEAHAGEAILSSLAGSGMEKSQGGGEAAGMAEGESGGDEVPLSETSSQTAASMSSSRRRRTGTPLAGAALEEDSNRDHRVPVA